ncbi:hypothetical protein L7F22_023459 [Adiantum nelumboides]|nr:hypothetical protein [Adiantum nelumboides]
MRQHRRQASLQDAVDGTGFVDLTVAGSDIVSEYTSDSEAEYNSEPVHDTSMLHRQVEWDCSSEPQLEAVRMSSHRHGEQVDSLDVHDESSCMVADMADLKANDALVMQSFLDAYSICAEDPGISSELLEIMLNGAQLVKEQGVEDTGIPNEEVSLAYESEQGNECPGYVDDVLAMYGCSELPSNGNHFETISVHLDSQMGTSVESFACTTGVVNEETILSEFLATLEAHDDWLEGVCMDDFRSDIAIATFKELILLDEHSMDYTECMQEEFFTDIHACCESLDAKCPVLPMKNASVDAFGDEDDGWGFENPLIKGSLAMDGYVQKTQERLQNLKIQKQAENMQHVSKRAQSLDALVEGLVPCTGDVIGSIMADMDVRDLIDSYDDRGVIKAGMNVMSDKLVLICTYVQEVNTSGYVIDGPYSYWDEAWSMLACTLATWKNSMLDVGGCVGLENIWGLFMLYPFDPGGCIYVSSMERSDHSFPFVCNVSWG